MASGKVPAYGQLCCRHLRPNHYDDSHCVAAPVRHDTRLASSTSFQIVAQMSHIWLMVGIALHKDMYVYMFMASQYGLTLKGRDLIKPL